MFERFTDRARHVITLAQEESRMLNHNCIGTEHMLLGLIHEVDGIAAKSLESLGISLEGARSQVEEILGRGYQAPSGHIPFTPRTKKVIEFSLREALQLGHSYIGTEHLLLGLIREGEGVAAEVLVKSGVELTQVRKRVLEVLNEEGEDGRRVAELVAVAEFEASLRRFVGSEDSSTARELILEALRKITDQIDVSRKETERLERAQVLLEQQLAQCPVPE